MTLVLAPSWFLLRVLRTGGALAGRGAGGSSRLFHMLTSGRPPDI